MKKRFLLYALSTALLMTACGERENNTKEQTETVSTEKENAEAKITEDDLDEVDFESFENKMKLMCYNIYYKEVESRSGDIQDLILKNDPDVLMLQEVSTEWLPYLQGFMEENKYSYYGYGRYGGEMSAADLQSGEQFTPILWKNDKYDLMDNGHFWLSSTPDVFSADWTDGFISKYPRCVNWVILKDKETGGEFMALCIHTDPESEAVRNRSSSLTVEMVNEISGNLPVVLAGDWNMSITDKAYSIVTEGGYIDVRFKAADTTYSGSFNDWGERADDSYAFGDHIFMSDDMAASSFEVVNDYYDGVHISDHCPLFTEIYY